MRGTLAVEAVDTGRMSNGTTSVGANGKIQPVVCCCGNSTASAGRRWLLLSISSRIDGTRGFGPFIWIQTLCKFSGFDLADKNCTSLDEQFDCWRGGLGGWVAVSPSLVSITSSEALEGKGIFDAESQAGQRLVMGRRWASESGGDWYSDMNLI